MKDLLVITLVVITICIIVSVLGSPRMYMEDQYTGQKIKCFKLGNFFFNVDDVRHFYIEKDGVIKQFEGFGFVRKGSADYDDSYLRGRYE